MHARKHTCSHSFTHSLTHSLTPSLTHACTHAHTHACTHARTHALTHSLTQHHHPWSLGGETRWKTVRGPPGWGLGVALNYPQKMTTCDRSQCQERWLLTFWIHVQCSWPACENWFKLYYSVVYEGLLMQNLTEKSFKLWNFKYNCSYRVWL